MLQNACSGRRLKLKPVCRQNQIGSFQKVWPIKFVRKTFAPSRRGGPVAPDQGQFEDAWRKNAAKIDQSAAIVGVIMDDHEISEQFLERRSYDLEECWIAPTFDVVKLDNQDAKSFEIFGAEAEQR